MGTTSVRPAAGATGTRGNGGGLVPGRRIGGGSAMRLSIVAGLTRKGPARVSFCAMRLGRAICVSLDEGVCRVVADALTAAGLTVEHATSIPADVSGAVAVIVDRATRVASPDTLKA